MIFINFIMVALLSFPYPLKITILARTLLFSEGGMSSFTHCMLTARTYARTQNLP